MMNLARDARWFALTILLAAPACGGTATSGLADSHGDDDAGADASRDGGANDASADTSTPDGSTPDSSTPDAKPTRVPKRHRPTAIACPTTRAAGPAGIPGEPNEGCSSDADCTAGKNGRCTFPGPIPVRECSYDECFVDGDCANGGSCDCGGMDGSRSAANVCIGGDCRVDGDCGANGFCSPTGSTSGCSDAASALYCHTANDTCLDESDCPDSDWCVFDTRVHHWTCIPQVVCGGTAQSSGGAH